MTRRRRAGDDAIELERLLARLRELGTELVNLDAYDRWGALTPEAHEEAHELASATAASKIETTARLEALVRRFRSENPDAVVEWARAHVALLDRRLAQIDDDDTQRVERNEAEGERRRWLSVESGEASFVDENPRYVKHDPRLYRAFFGFEPKGQ